ncbi:carbohydrate ABC transporter permease [Paenibacillus sp. F411]|uniref:Protein LplC n=1 Tax=Paenibacillus algicola TaxID=2565926 RepID=A0A4P8XI96_9BACL|nr:MULTISPECIES: carbohydrate ABC transporter permease [Paenibacillus]MBO2943390.1 carbohydrate ABC transporter permease [Paenibacillus sp. F411]QCT02038.1 protein LplC [Paenibacillus algicola]
MSRSLEQKLFHSAGYLFLIALAVLCVLPLLFIFGGSFTSEQSVIRNGFSLIPKEWSLEAYELAFKNPKDLFQAYFISFSVVAVGTAAGLLMTAMTGYVLSRRDFKYRNFFSFFIYFTSVFSGGLVPWYIMMVSYLDMKNNFLALILPLLLNVFYIIVMKSFMSGIPFEIIESGKMDGANELRIFFKIILPVSGPALATIGLFIALQYWNDFFSAMLFITDQSLMPLQYYLYKMVNSMDALSRMASMSGVPIPQMPKETLKLAMTALVVLPIIFVYPFVQRHIIGGVTVGAVKG